MRKKHILNTGDKFGKWEILRQAPSRKYNTFYLCKCECGSISEVMSYKLINGISKQCKRCHMANMTGSNAVMHGKTKSKLYNVWRGIIKRTTLESHHNYKNYGGRGITICDEWKNDFLSFYSWACTSGYKKGLSIDRIDNDGDYEPPNCRWASAETQGNNRRDTIFVFYDGEKMGLAQWARKFEIDYGKVYLRYQKGISLNNIKLELKGE